MERQSAIVARLLSLIAFLNFDDVFSALFGRLRGGGKGWQEAQEKRLIDSGSYTSHLKVRLIGMLSKRYLESSRFIH